jgi:hypothetical protein
MVEHELVNRRAASRVAIHMPATVTIASTDFDCVIENLSLGGAQVCCGLPVAIGEKLGLFFVLDGLREVIDTTVIVRWRRSTELGVQFTGLRAREMWALGHFLRGTSPAAASA